MEKTKTETLSLRVPQELKAQFEEKFLQSGEESKAELLRKLLETDSTSEKTSEVEVTETLPGDTQEKSTGLSESNEKTDPDTENEKVTEIRIKLNPVQLFAMRETVLGPDFIGETNEEVEKIENAVDNSFFGKRRYSGIYAGVFEKMDPDTENNEVILQNIGAMLVNLFMSNLISGTADLNSPVTDRILQEFINEQNSSEDLSE